jgi:sulfate adenylyltransferase
MTRGCTIFFTGLSGAGKSTLAKALVARLGETDPRPVTLLDGDLVRQQMSPELGFSREHRAINVRRIGFAALEITRNGGLAVCAAIAPHAGVRDEVRHMIAPVGGFVLVYVATPLDVCEARDPKGLYAKARAGVIESFTGISDPYEAPDAPDVTIDTTCTSPDEAIERILSFMTRHGFADESSLPT